MFLIFDRITGVPKLAPADDEFGSAFAESTGTTPASRDDTGGEGATGQSGDTADTASTGDARGTEAEGGAEGDAGDGTDEGTRSGDSGDAATGENQDDGAAGEPSTQTPAKGDQGQAPATDKSKQGQTPAVAGDGGEPADHGQPKHQRVDPAALQAAMQVLQQRQQPQGHQPQPQGQQPQQRQQPQQEQNQGQQGQATDWTQYLTNEERTALQSYDKEWQEVSQAEQIRTNAMLRQAREQILSEVQQTLAPVVQEYQQSQEAKHFGRIREAHTDFDDLTESGQLVVWATSQPNPVVRDNAVQILQQGNADQVIGLIDLFKQAQGQPSQGQQQQANTGQSTGAAPATPASSQAPAQGSGQQQQQPQQPKVKPKQAPSADAVAATAAVKTGSRGGDPRGADQNDFLAGFEETAREAS